MKRYWQKFLLYAKLPEMRLFWFFLPFLIILLTVNIFYLPKLLVFATVIIFFVLGAIILVNNLRLARSNLEIKIERNELKSIIINLRDGVIAYDPNFKIVIFNRAAEEIFNLQALEIIGQSFSPERAREPRFKLLSQAIFPSLAPLVIRRSEPGIYPQIIDLSLDEPQIELRVSTDKIIDSNGQLLGFVKLVHDRTREVELMRSKTEFITIASHQLRTPLTGIHWALESLSKQILSEEQKGLLDTAFQETTNLSKTVNDLLDVSKIEEGKFGYQFENVNIVDFIEETIVSVQDLAKQFGIKLYFQKSEEPSIVVSIDSQKLGIVLFNLFDNAIRYNVANGQVTATIERVKDEPYVQVSVKDTGIGVPADQINKLFAKFFRADNAVKFAPGGSGLGLYIAKNIIKRHGGEIRVESEINRGTTFYFTLPTDPKLIPSKEMVYGEE
ncbi:MAG: ATP-binding protein [Patescibacteria group bacterium]